MLGGNLHRLVRILQEPMEIQDPPQGTQDRLTFRTT